MRKGKHQFALGIVKSNGKFLGPVTTFDEFGYKDGVLKLTSIYVVLAMQQAIDTKGTIVLRKLMKNSEPLEIMTANPKTWSVKKLKNKIKKRYLNAYAERGIYTNK